VPWPTYFVVSTIVHFDSTSTLALHIGDQREAEIWLLKAMDKGTAQGRRVASNCPHNGFGGKGSILKVSGAYLPKKQKGEIREITEKGRRLRPTTSDGKGKEPKLHLTD